MQYELGNMATERDPTCNPVDPLLSGNDDYKPYPTQPENYAQQTGMGSAVNKPPPMQPSAEEMRNFDIVRATQYGVYERCIELVEGGFDVNQVDKENVSLLHWAAINNRADLVKYYISKGAIVDKFGGDLNSTPLHWAARQGHLSMVVLLMSFGADPSLRDGEGCSCIHLASQFGHTAIVAYLIAKGQDVDMQDRNGMTALMWAAYRVFGPDPTRLLLTFNASTTMVDKFHQNTALHWACTSGNHVSVRQLVDVGANVDIPNDQGETPLQIAMKKKGTWIQTKLRMAQASRNYSDDTFMGKLTSDPKIKKKVIWVFPFIMIFLIGFVFEIRAAWWVKVILLSLTFMFYRLIHKYFIDFTAWITAPIAIYLATKFWMYFTWFVYYWPYVNNYSTQLPFLINTALLMYNFWKAWKSDPGIIDTGREEKIKTILDLAETQLLDLNQFCSTCVVRRPLRSKHCSVCNKCIAKFDHHCPWIDNCVGAGNHKYFIGYLLFLFGMINWCLAGAGIYYQNTAGIDYTSDGLFIILSKITHASPWVFWIACNAAIHLLWVGSLLACQLYQIIILGVTTNERLNFPRYKHFHTVKPGKFKSPFHHGYIQNFIDLVGWRCFGCFRPSPTNWKEVFSLDPVTTIPQRTPFHVQRDNYQFV